MLANVDSSSGLLRPDTRPLSMRTQHPQRVTNAFSLLLASSIVDSKA